MEIDLFRLPLDTSYQSLEKFNGIKFTRREIDIVSCIISGRAATKTIASFLSIEPKTVEVHTRNIRLKLECNSRENIVNFIEKAGKFLETRQHYFLLFTQSAFEQKLRQLSSLIIQKNFSCLIVYEKPYELFTEQLRKYFKYLGIEGIFRIKETDKPLNDLFQGIDSQSIAHCLLVTSPLWLKQFLLKENLEDARLSQVLQYPEAITFVSLGKAPEEMCQEMHEINSMAHIRFGNSESYYLSFFDLFKKLFPNIIFDNLISEFKEQYNAFNNNFSDKNSFISTSERKYSEHRRQVFYHLFSNFVKKQSGKLWISSLLCISVFCTFILAFKGNSPDKIIPVNQIQKNKAIRSDLPLPYDNLILKRPNIMKHIEGALRGEDGIQAVALVGIGGAGKTTIARQYAHQQNSEVIWEMNAETKEKLIGSFESLAYSLAKTEIERKILKGLQEIKDFKERIEKIILFIKERLKTYSSWFLIYDNVDKFSDIEKYFPNDSKAWGKGKIIITTRDSNIKNNNYIKHVFQVAELTQEEKLSLFIKIVDTEDRKLLLPEQKEQTEKFLTSLPPFPLDISVAAFYLKATQISFKKYLEHMKEFNKDFESVHENILRESSDYTKTRYSIVILSLNRLIEIHPDFKELLLFISLLDSQNIPFSLLSKYKNEMSVENFIYNLKKYSLITPQLLSSFWSHPTFSIHRNTQEISLFYLIKTLNLDRNRLFLKNITEALGKYTTEALEEEDFHKIKFSLRHCERFLSHQSLLLDREMRTRIEGGLGGIYLYLDHYKKAKELLEKSYEHNSKEHMEMVRNFLYLGKTYEKLGHYKKARDILEKNLLLYRRYLDKHPLKLAWTLRYLGAIHRELGDFQKAKDMLTKSLEIYKKHTPQNTINIARVLGLLGHVYKASLDYERSKDMLNQSLMLYRKYLPENQIMIAWTLAHLGSCYRELGNFKKAKELLERSLLIYKKYFSENPVKFYWVLAFLGNVYRDLGEYDRAKTLLEESLKISKEYLPENMDIGWILGSLGLFYKDVGDYQKAKFFFEESLLIYRKHLPEDHVRVIKIFSYLGNLHRELKNYEEAKRIFQRCLLFYEKHFKEIHIEQARVWNSLGQVYLLENRLQSAENLLKQSFKVFQEKNHPDSYLSLENLAEVYIKKSMHVKEEDNKAFRNQAIDYLKQAQDIAQIHFPKSSQHILRIQEKINKLSVCES